ncbi:MAG: glycoside hydrolase family 30 protein [Myxococcota bacterium]
MTSAAGDAARSFSLSPATGDAPDGTIHVTVSLDQPRQTFEGVGGALTQASAHALLQISSEKRHQVLMDYFSPGGAAFTLNRTHIASCDFSTYSYTYAEDADPSLAGFSIDVDNANGHLDLIKDALAIPGASFRLMASPWTAPPWMKDNGQYFDSHERRGGTLREEMQPVFAEYVARYLKAYRAEGVDIWMLTTLNEPHGNNGSWESMEMSPAQQAAYVQQLKDAIQRHDVDAKILVYDQNRAGVREFAGPILRDPAAAAAVHGTAVHWYDSTFRIYEDELEKHHADFPDKPIFQTEGCIDNVYGKDLPYTGPDAPSPWWKDDGWYWRKVATDWGWEHLPDPHTDHPPYAAAFRYARDIVGGMAHWVAGWTDWNIVLDRRGGPNHVGNFCLAPVLVDGPADEVYYTPLFFILKQVSRTSRPGATVYGVRPSQPVDGLWVTALENPDGSRVVHLFNESETPRRCRVAFGGSSADVTVPAASIVTAVLSGG